MMLKTQSTAAAPHMRVRLSTAFVLLHNHTLSPYCLRHNYDA